MKFIFQPNQKGWFKALGWHHAAVTICFILINHFLTFGDYAAVAAFSWFTSREITEYQRRGNTAFEIMDVLSPAIVVVGYLVWGRV